MSGRRDVDDLIREALGAEGVEGLDRWGAGLLICAASVLGCKIWYWILLERLALTREIRTAELLAARLALRMRAQPG